MSDSSAITERMQYLIRKWEHQQDPRAVFLGCYRLMTLNMLTAIGAQEFHDPIWVDGLLAHFAGYYFTALEAYDTNPVSASPIWQLTFTAVRQPDTLMMQNLLLGVNAHINFDLIFTLVDVLEGEWSNLDTLQRQQRYQDHCHVNEVIHRTVDAVQDMVIEPRQPVMDIFDRLLGSVDEWAISRLISYWRDQVWQDAVSVLEASSPQEKAHLRQKAEVEALQRGKIILKLG